MNQNTLSVRPGLPANAKKVFHGIIFEVWQWDQIMFDGSTEIFEKIWRVPTVEVIAVVEDKIMIEYQDQPDRSNSITLVSGRADKSTNMLEEAQRELLEETGYASDTWEHLFTFGSEGKLIHEVFFFIAKDCKKIAAQNLDAGEKIQTKLISFEEFLQLSEEPKFWASTKFINFLLRLQHDEKKKNEFKKLLFS